MDRKLEPNYAVRIYSSPATVFTANQLALMFGETDSGRLKSRLHYYVRKGVLLNLRRGIYAKPDYSREELATKIYTPSYISLETVLLKEGVIFQYYETIFAVSYLTRAIQVGNQGIQYRRIAPEILGDPRGLINRGNYTAATKERAFMDAVYLYKDYYFDNLSRLDRQALEELFPVYPTRTVARAKEMVRL